jgi:hypothetical protein
MRRRKIKTKSIVAAGRQTAAFFHQLWMLLSAEQPLREFCTGLNLCFTPVLTLTLSPGEREFIPRED